MAQLWWLSGFFLVDTGSLCRILYHEEIAAVFTLSYSPRDSIICGGCLRSLIASCLLNKIDCFAISVDLVMQLHVS